MHKYLTKFLLNISVPQSTDHKKKYSLTKSKIVFYVVKFTRNGNIISTKQDFSLKRQDL